MLTHLPVIADPSHATGRRDLVAPMSRAAVTAGADGLMVEVHPNPERAKCDGPQSLTPDDFSAHDGGRQAARSSSRASIWESNRRERTRRVRTRRDRRRRAHRRVDGSGAQAPRVTRPFVVGIDTDAEALEYARRARHRRRGRARRQRYREREWLGPEGVDLVVIATPARYAAGWLERLGARRLSRRRHRCRVDEGGRARGRP